MIFYENTSTKTLSISIDECKEMKMHFKVIEGENFYHLVGLVMLSRNDI